MRARNDCLFETFRLAHDRFILGGRTSTQEISCFCVGPFSEHKFGNYQLDERATWRERESSYGNKFILS